ncbi:MAG TPA: LuxR C-terminal-related transcriptional regulator [Thermoanaerobaculia bacterium]
MPSRRRKGPVPRSSAWDSTSNGQRDLSENTVKFHVRNILDKLRLHNRAQVVAYALKNKMVDAD